MTRSSARGPYASDCPSSRASAGYLTLALLLTAVAGGGCGPTEPGLVSVRGKVTLDGGPWPKEGLLNFTPVGEPGGSAPSTQIRPGSAKFGVDGSFTAGSFVEGDGLFPGTYQVAVDCPDSEPKMSDNGRMVEAKNAAPKKFQSGSTSGLTLTVKPGERVTDASFDVTTK